MALTINKTIGTNRGITDNAYVRIEKFEVDSYTGVIKVYPTLYMNYEAASSASKFEFNEYSPVQTREQFGCSTIDFSDSYKFYLTSSIEKTREVSVTQETSSSNEIQVPDGTGSRTEVVWSTQISESLVEETYEQPIVDISAITGSTIYEFAYPLLKYELKQVFGSDSVDDI